MNKNSTPDLEVIKVIEGKQAKIIGGIGLFLLLMTFLFWPGNPYGFKANSRLYATITPAADTLVPSPSPSLSPSPPPSITPLPSPTFQPLERSFPSIYGTLVLSIQEGADTHLFAYRPLVEQSSQHGNQALPLTRLTSGNHDDIDPAVSPDGSKIAFSSNRGGPWDVYILNLETGETEQFTNTLAYEGSPTWSPDGKWLAYESYQNQNLEILIQDAARAGGPINLTNHPAVDHSPSWSGQGRRISFISLRDGSPQIWMANLDSPDEEKATAITAYQAAVVKHPTWTADGRYLTWAVISDQGSHTLTTWDSQHPERDPFPSGTGDWPVWDGAGKILYTLVETPYQTFLTGYPGEAADFPILLPAVKMPGAVKGLSWAPEIQLNTLQTSSSALNSPSASAASGNSNPAADLDLTPISGVQVPFSQLNEQAVDSFQTLRSATEDLLGWDYLGTLDNAYVPLSEPLDPGIERDWLHTGRAIEISDLPRKAGWMHVVREDYFGETYWRIYLRTSNQQGYLGRPLKDLPWDFDARYAGSNQNYENGGSLASAPPAGYYLDFTDLAAAHGWERLPALRIWQSSNALARFQKFVFRENLTWWEAMLQIHPGGAVQELVGE